MQSTLVIRHSKRNVSYLTPEQSEASHWTDILIRVGQQRDRQAFAELFRHFAPLIKGFAASAEGASRLPDFGDELVQEVMIKVWRKAALYREDKSSASTWIYAIARNCRIDLIRRHSGSPTVALEAEDYWEVEDEETPAGNLTRLRDQQRAHQLLGKLPGDQRDILRKTYMESKSQSEIAEELNLPLGTVKSRVRLAMKKLQELTAP